MLNIRLLGQFDLRLEGKELELPSRPAQMLLAYLLLNRQVPFRREHLAGLLWADSEESNARKNLRNALWQLRRTIGDVYLDTDRSSLAFNLSGPHSLDVAILESRPDTSDPEALLPIVSVYEGDLLPGFYEDWVLLERERLRSLFESQMGALLDGLSAAGRWTDLKGWAERWIAMGQVPEPAYRALMLASAGLGDLAGMASSYRRCVHVLEEELGVPPSPDTQALYERLARGDVALAAPQKGAVAIALEAAAATVPAESPPVESRASAFPAWSTPFVGRREELAEIGRLLEHEPDCRLLTLLGQGGIGKTRLAVEAARAVAFVDGACFVALAPLAPNASLVPTIAEALQLPLSGLNGGRDRILAHLRQREQLLILDNFEHLLFPLHRSAGEQGGDSTALLSAILEEAPRVKLLVTSRERLNLGAEWVFNVEGLRLPEQREGEEGFETESSSAVELFMRRARQLNRNFAQDAGALACVVEICRLVGGMPLGIELAAAWAGVLSSHEILEEIRRNLDFLSSGRRDLAERHRDVRTVFDTSWNMLGEPERRLFAQLSVFRGGFTREAAEAAAVPAPRQRHAEVLAALATLTDKSFIRPTPGGRYEIHELMRQYGAAKLLEQPERERLAQDSHSSYYLTYLQQQEALLRGSDQRQGLELVASEIENIKVAWKWAIDQANLADLEKTLTAYFNFWVTRGGHREGADGLAYLVQQLERKGLAEQPLYHVIRARALIRMGALSYQVGDYRLARSQLEQGLQTALDTDFPSEVTFGQLVLGKIAGWQGDKGVAEQQLQRALALSEAMDDRLNLADVLHELADVASTFGDYARARDLASRSLRLSRDLGRPDWVAYAQLSLGRATASLGEYDEALACYEEALAIFQSLDSRHGMADALGGLGWVAWCREEFTQAGPYLQQSLTILQELANRRLIAQMLYNLALLALDQEEFTRAEALGREGLALAGELHSSIYTLSHLGCLGGAACGLGAYADGRHLLEQALQLARDIQCWPLATFVVYQLAQLLLKESAPDDLDVRGQAHTLLSFVVEHPGSSHAVRERAWRVQARVEAELPAGDILHAWTKGNSYSLDTLMG